MMFGKRVYADCETTGTKPDRHGIIQLAGIVFVDGQKVDSFNLHMQPFPDDEIEDSALAANGITREQLFSPDRMKPGLAYAHFIKIMDKYVAKMVRHDKAFWIGYKSPFDYDFMWEWFKKNGDVYFGSWFFAPPLCVMNLAATLLQTKRAQMPNFKLQTVFNEVFPGHTYTDDQWHDGLFDIERTVELEDGCRKIVAGIRAADSR